MTWTVSFTNGVFWFAGMSAGGPVRVDWLGWLWYGVTVIPVGLGVSALLAVLAPVLRRMEIRTRRHSWLAVFAMLPVGIWLGAGLSLTTPLEPSLRLPGVAVGALVFGILVGVVWIPYLAIRRRGRPAWAVLVVATLVAPVVFIATSLSTVTLVAVLGVSL